MHPSALPLVALPPAVPRLAALLACLLLLVVAPARGQIFVDADNASGTEDGASWATAFTSLQAALDAAAPDSQIWVAAGVYRPDDGPGVAPGDRRASFRLTGALDGVEIYGGFDGIGPDGTGGVQETHLAARSPQTYVTVLSGDFDGDDAPGAHGTTAEGTGIEGDNAYHVLFLDGAADGPITAATVLDGLTITGGHADGGEMESAGGGLYCHGAGHGSACSPTLRRLTFVGNAAVDGGALLLDGSDGASRPHVVNSAFYHNNASLAGGALFVVGDGGDISAQFHGALFADNGKDHLSFDDGDAEAPMRFVNCTFTGATEYVVDVRYFDSSQTPIEVVNSILWNNNDDMVGTRQPMMQHPDDALRVTYSVVEERRYVEGRGRVPPGEGNLNEHPLFVDAAAPLGADSTLGTPDDGLRPRPVSPAVNVGDSTAVPDALAHDLAGHARVSDERVDLGAYETGGTVRLFVDADNASGVEDGGTWATAFTSLQAALDAATDDSEIWIAGGVYRPDDGSGVTAGDRNAAFRLTGALDGVALYGGFDGVSPDSSGGAREDSLAMRDPQLHVTVLSGDLAGDDVVTADSVTVAPDSIRGTNAYHVFFLDGSTAAGPITEATVLDGVTVTGGHANGAFPHNVGGGLFCRSEGREDLCRPTLRDVTFVGNAALGDEPDVYGHEDERLMGGDF